MKTLEKNILSRRTLIQRSTAAGLGALLSGLPKGWVGSAYADDSPETADIKLGIIDLCHWLWQPRKGVTRTAPVDGFIEPVGYVLPSRVRAYLDPYIRPGIG